MVMQLKSALPVVAGGLLLAWTGLAAAANAAAPPPPAAPIFYCPSAPPKAGAAAAPQACPAPAHAAPSEHHARVHRRYEHRYVGRAAPSEDVSASQAFIYRYERAQHGLDARAADAAWRMGPPPCPMHMQGPHGCMPQHREWAEAAPPPPPPQPQVIVERAPPQPPQVIVERAPPQQQQVIIEREAPPPPNVIIEHAPAPPPRIVFERAPAPPPVVIRERAPACPDGCPPTEYGWEHHGQVHGGYAGHGYARSGYSIERSESEHSGGWRYVERNGQGHYQSWGDAARGGSCPPRVVEAGGCSAAAAAYASGEAGWQDGSYGEVYGYQGRDAYGYLVWPGKR